MITQTKGYPRVQTVGIVSASNEAGRQLSNAENDRRDEALRRDLTGYLWHQVRDRFGRVDKPMLSMVNPFVVADVIKEAVVALGAKYRQFHVIFGAREGEDEDTAWRFELLEADWTARVVAVRKVFVNERKRRLYLDAGCPDDEGVSFLIPVEHEQLRR